MERLVFCVLTLLAVLTVHAQETPRAAVFDAYAWDFGTIREADGDVSHVFHLLNNSTEPVSVSRAIPGCSCISASFGREPVMPGRAGDVVVTYSPSGAVGETYRTIELVDGKGASLGMLSTHADVVPADRSIQERYFYSMADLLYANQTNVLFGYAYPDSVTEKKIYIANASDRPMQLRCGMSGDGGLEADAPVQLQPEEEAAVSLKFSVPAGRLYRTVRDTVWMYADGKRVRLPIVTTAICMAPVPKRTDAPDMQTYPSVGKLSKSWFSDSYTGSVEVSNKGRSDLLVLAVEAPADVTVNVSGGTGVRPGASFRVKVETASNREFRVNLFTNDPKRPFKELIFKYIK